VETDYPRQATSRAYYAGFYAARAALEAVGEEPKTHTGLRSRFAEFARSCPELGPELGRILSQLETGRTDADYGQPSITREEATDAIAKAERLVEAIERFLGACADS
jgi:uncharacterized protein (UPF0332 family)